MGDRNENKVLIIDDHPLFREALRGLFTRIDKRIVVLEASTCHEGIEVAQEFDDISFILLDLGLPDVSGHEGVILVRERCPTIPLIVISASADRETVSEVIQKGSMGFIAKTSNTDEIDKAVRRVLNDGIYIPSGMFTSGGFLTHPLHKIKTTNTDVKPADLGLTNVQARILKMVLQGKSTDQISRELSLTEGAVKLEVSQILKAMHALDRREAVYIAASLGLNLGDINDET